METRGSTLQEVWILSTLPMIYYPSKGCEKRALVRFLIALLAASAQRIFYGQADRKGGRVNPLCPDRKQM